MKFPFRWNPKTFRERIRLLLPPVAGGAVLLVLLGIVANMTWQDYRFARCIPDSLPHNPPRFSPRSRMPP